MSDRFPVKGLDFDFSLSQLNEAKTSLVILQSNPVKLCYSYLVKFVQTSLTVENRLLQNKRQRHLIHPLVLAINKEEQQTGAEEADWDSLRYTSKNLDNQGTNQVAKHTN